VVAVEKPPVHLKRFLVACQCFLWMTQGLEAGPDVAEAGRYIRIIAFEQGSLHRQRILVSSQCLGRVTEMIEAHGGVIQALCNIGLVSLSQLIHHGQRLLERCEGLVNIAELELGDSQFVKGFRHMLMRIRRMGEAFQCHYPVGCQFRRFAVLQLDQGMGHASPELGRSACLAFALPGARQCLGLLEAGTDLSPAHQVQNRLDLGPAYFLTVFGDCWIRDQAIGLFQGTRREPDRNTQYTDGPTK
jgi:hypothetical protein